MNHPYPPASLAAPADARLTPKISGHRLVFVRLAWLCVVLVCLGLWISMFPLGYRNALSFSDNAAILSPDIVRPGLTELGLPAELYALFNFARMVLVSLGFIIIGAVIFGRKSDEWAALYFSLILIVFGVALSAPLAIGSSPLPPSLDLLINLAFGSLFFSFYLFPDGRFEPHWTRWLMIVWALGAVGVSVLAGSPLDFNTWPPLVALPHALILLGSVPFSLIYRYRRYSSATQRQQIKWVVLGFTVAVAAFFAFWMPVGIASQPSRAAALYDLIGGSLLLGAFLLVPLSIGFAILRYRLWDIDLILNRTLVYGALTAGVVGLYVLIVGGLGTLFQARGNLFLSLVTTGFIAVAFQPLRDRLQKGVNRLMYGEREEPYVVVSRLGQRLEGTLEPFAVLPTIVQTVREALKLPYVAITLERGDERVIAASSGAPTYEPLHLPLIYQGQEVGELIVAPRAKGETFSASDRRLLDDLARQIGVAAHAARLTADLQRSRERLVTAREEERRRLRRDLHDGLGPRLASQTLKLEAARDFLGTDPARSKALLNDLIVQSQGLIADIRGLVYALRPPALDDLGLLSTLQEQLAQYGQTGIEFHFEAPEGLPPLPAAVEVAAYRIIQEAITNVVKHARARSCYVRLELEESMLRLEVLDDGRGLPAELPSGIGLRSMRERAEELGGTCVVESIQGTRVRAHLPCEGV